MLAIFGLYMKNLSINYTSMCGGGIQGLFERCEISLAKGERVYGLGL
jgi:hypothetical protein